MQVFQKYFRLSSKSKWLNELDKLLAEQGGLVDTTLLGLGIRKHLLLTETQVLQWPRRESKEATFSSVFR